jgi:hypothetical protein
MNHVFYMLFNLQAFQPPLLVCSSRQLLLMLHLIPSCAPLIIKCVEYAECNNTLPLKRFLTLEICIIMELPQESMQNYRNCNWIFSSPSHVASSRKEFDNWINPTTTTLLSFFLSFLFKIEHDKLWSWIVTFCTFYTCYNWRCTWWNQRKQRQ